MLFIFSQPQYSFQALRAAGAASSGAADIGECLAAATLVQEGDDESWYLAWSHLAERLEQEAKESQKHGHFQSARSAFFRATTYFRTAEFFLHSNVRDHRILTTWRKSRDCFCSGAQYLNHPLVPVTIPFEGGSLPGYMCLVDGSGEKRPCVIVQTGFDGTKEELYFSIGKAIVERGMNCLLFEGPGQGAVIREQNIPFRHNWETVITPVVDFVLERNEIDAQKIALIGMSFGGYLVPRALAFEKRVGVGIVNGGIYDFHEVCMHGYPEIEPLLDDEHSCETLNAEIVKEMHTNPSIRWAFSQGMYTFAAATPVEWLRKTREYRLETVVSQISCPMLVVDSEHDTLTGGQSKQLYAALRSPKSFLFFTEEEGAGEHCQVGASMLSQERLLNWLQEQWV